MKNRIFIIISVCFLAAASISNFNLAQNNIYNDITLKDIAVMAQANSETGNGEYIEGYYNDMIIVYEYNGTIYLDGLPLNFDIQIGASGELHFCKSSFWWYKRCHLDLIGYTPFS